MNINFKGNIGKDAELRKVNINNVDTAVCSFWVAENIPHRDNKKETQWHKVTIWRGYAEKMAQWLKQGRYVFVEATYAKPNKYTTNDGRIIPYFDVQASAITFLDKKAEEEEVPPTEELDTEETPWD